MNNSKPNLQNESILASLSYRKKKECIVENSNEFGDGYLLCPTCGVVVGNSKFDIHPFCSECGQALTVKE